jgi:phage shock protein PspC (stress-responsive transcriptional regulator)
MEKIININMAGRVIAIEDKAYIRLKAYLETLNQYFQGEEGQDEIMNDIESRIAELMEEKIRRGSMSIDEAAVEEIMASIGRVEDFAASEDEQRTEARTETTKRTRKSKRFTRDINDKILGGVCSGLANYLDVDPALVRIVFAILTLGGWGAGLLIYLLLWIFVPAAPLESYHGRRLYRDAEDKWLGGVCSGLASYFDKEPWMFRLIFVAPFVLNIFSNGFGFFGYAHLFFGSVTGTFALIYIVLWIVLPLAKTDFQKMEMRGEKVDLQRIRENVVADMKDRAKTFSQEVKDAASRVGKESSDFMNTRGKEFAREAADVARPIASKGGHIIGSILKGILIFIGSFIAVTLFFMLIGYAFGGFSDLVNEFIFRTAQQRSLGWATVVLFLGVPCLALVTFMVRRGLRIRTGGRYFAMGYSLLWVFGWICLICLAVELSKDFRRTETVITEVPIQQPVNGKLFLSVPGPAIEYGNGIAWVKGDIHGFDIADGVIHTAAVGVYARVSPDSQYHLVIRRTSMGSDRQDAMNTAGRIQYHMSSVSDSVVNMDSGYQISRETGYRGQNVWVEVQVPAGKKIHFDESVSDKLYAVDYPNRHRYNAGYRHGRGYYTEEYDDQNEDWEPGIDYVMNADGTLRDVNHSADSEEQNEQQQEKAQAQTTYKADSIDREIESLEREKERLEKNSN